MSIIHWIYPSFLARSACRFVSSVATLLSLLLIAPLPALAQQATPTTPGEAFRDCDACPEMVVIPEGTFTMGSPDDEADRKDREGPQHEVTIARFAVGRYEVTRGEYARYVEESGAPSGDQCWIYERGNSYKKGKWKKQEGPNWRSPGYDQDDNHPVVCVSWEDARGYVNWLSRETGETYRLLSEAEWEYAARAGTTTARPWGEDSSLACEHANVGDEAKKEYYKRGKIHSCRDGHVFTAPVGEYGGNGFGLHEMVGNVYEWVEDCWHDDYQGAPSDGRAWTSDGDCGKRVLRGGSWSCQPTCARSAYRWRTSDTSVGSLVVGFRVARTLD